MKITVSGKGGAGKSLLIAVLSRILTEPPYPFITIDTNQTATLSPCLNALFR